MVDLGPVSSDPNQWLPQPRLHHVSGISHYCYVQHRRGITGKPRRPYSLVITETADGRRNARTIRYDPEHGVPEAKGVPAKREEIPRAPRTIRICVCIVAFALLVIINHLIFGIGAFLSIPVFFYLVPRVIEKIERKRLETAKLREDHELPPLLSTDELDTRLSQLSQPDEDRTYDEPPPMPMHPLLRDQAWQRWNERYSHAATRSAGYVFMGNPEHHSDRPWCNDRLIKQGLAGQEQVERLRNIQARYPATDVTVLQSSVDSFAEQFGRVIHGITDPAVMDGPPELDRTFTTRTDCANGHVGEHPILSTFTDRNGDRRVRRACRWCVSTWSDLV